MTSLKHVVMPNHFHAIIAINRADMESAPTLSVIVQSFKRNTTIKYINAVKEGKYPPFNKRIWQRNYLFIQRSIFCDNMYAEQGHVIW